MKKFIHLDLFHLSLVLSLLRLYPNLYRETTDNYELYGHDVYLGDSAAYIQTRFHNLNNRHINGFVHPKSIDNEIERSLFIHDVNSLYRRPGWNTNSPRRGTNVFAYILNELQPQSISNTTNSTQEAQSSESHTEGSAAELTLEDMNLIEILWRQDIDLGVSREVFDGSLKPKEVPEGEKKEKPPDLPTSSTFNPWQGLNYSVDSETGEHIALPSNETSSSAAALVPNDYVDITLEEALSLFDTDNVNRQEKPNEALDTDDFLLGGEVPFPDALPDQSLLEQLQDLQNLVAESHSEPLSAEYGAINSSYLENPDTYNETDNNHAILDALLQNTTLALPMDESILNASYHSGDEFDMEHDENINTLLSFLSNGSDPNPVGAVGGQDHQTLDPSLPLGNLTMDTSFLSELINESNIDFSEFCESTNPVTPAGNTIDWYPSTSSDSAISNMESDWSDSCSVSTNHSNGMVQNADSKNMKFKLPSGSLNNQEMFRPKSTFPVPKKYQFFGKQEPLECKDKHGSKSTDRLFSSSSSPDEEGENPSSTESSSPPRMSFMHNHTYHYNGDAVTDNGASQKPLERDKPDRKAEGSIRGTRDEKRLNRAKLPLSVKEIVELPIEQFNEKLLQLGLSEEQLSLLRDIRRRGKNKLAARSCRKRKIDQISDLQVIIDSLQHKRDMAHEV